MKLNKKLLVKKTMKNSSTNPFLTEEYAQTLLDLKKQISEAQIKATLAANKELIKLYWHIGKTIVEKQKTYAWGSQVIERLAHDLQNLFPGIQGFSRANVFRMQAFYTTYEKVAQAVRQIDELPFFNIPWGHNVVIMQRLKNDQERFWYAQQTIENGWSRSMLETWIKSKLHQRQGKAISNFSRTLPSPDSDIAHQTLKDPYIFDFLTLQEQHFEQDVEQGLIDHIQKFLLELGQGFAFVGRQYHLEVGESDFYMDLLFYHLKLRCYFVIELKNTDFKPEYTGQLNFYLSAVDDLLRVPDDKPTIGLLLCKTKNNIIAEYALRDINKPMGIAEYETRLVESLPKNLKSSLPSIEEIEAELEKHSQTKQANVTKKRP